MAPRDAAGVERQRQFGRGPGPNGSNSGRAARVVACPRPGEGDADLPPTSHGATMPAPQGLDHGGGDAEQHPPLAVAVVVAAEGRTGRCPSAAAKIGDQRTAMKPRLAMVDAPTSERTRIRVRPPRLRASRAATRPAAQPRSAVPGGQHVVHRLVVAHLPVISGRPSAELIVYPFPRAVGPAHHPTRDRVAQLPQVLIGEEASTGSW